MKAVNIDTFGGPEVLVLREYPEPIPNDEQLLIKVKACALNRADTLQRKGHYPPPPGESNILGLEIAGEVVAVGAKVTEFKKGARVFGLVGSGAYAQYCCLDAQMAMPIPDGLADVQAAAIAEVFLTANEALFTLGNLNKGESVLIHAGASGVGTAAIQLARLCGAHVYVTAGSREKVDLALGLGASAGINYHEQAFAPWIDKLTTGIGVDVVLDFIGADYLEDNLKVLKTKGRLVHIALLGGDQANISLRTVLFKRLQLKGLVMRAQSLAEKRAFTQRFKDRWLSCFTDAQLKPIIDSTYPLSEVVQAHQRMEANLNAGKIVLVVEH